MAGADAEPGNLRFHVYNIIYGESYWKACGNFKGGLQFKVSSHCPQRMLAGWELEGALTSSVCAGPRAAPRLDPEPLARQVELQPSGGTFLGVRSCLELMGRPVPPLLKCAG